MSCARRQDCDVSGANGDCGSILTAEHDLCVAGSEAEDFVCRGVIVVEIEDAIAPLWRPSVLGKEAFHRTSQIRRSIESTAVKKNRKRVVRHPAVGLEMELFRSYRRIEAATALPAIPTATIPLANWRRSMGFVMASLKIRWHRRIGVF